jgi:hypothetical protein
LPFISPPSVRIQLGFLNLLLEREKRKTSVPLLPLFQRGQKPPNGGHRQLSDIYMSFIIDHSKPSTCNIFNEDIIEYLQQL